MLGFPVLVGLIAVALAFDFLNGLHDAANSIATIVSTRVLPPQYAVFWAAFFNFIVFLFLWCHGFFCGDLRLRSIIFFAPSNSSPPRFIPSATAATTHRRRWGLL